MQISNLEKEWSNDPFSLSGTNVKDTANCTSQGQGCSPCTTAHPCSPIIISHTVHTQHYCNCYSNKDTSQTTTHVNIYLYTETWWQCWTCPSCGRTRPVREKEKRNSQVSICVHSWIIALERVGTATNRIFMHTFGSKAQENQGSSIGPWTHRNQTILFSGSMF